MLKFIAVAGSSLAFLTPSMAENMTMMPGTVRVLKSETAFDTFVVGDPEIAEVSVHSDHDFSVTAKKEGVTTIVALTNSKSVAGEYLITVHAPESTFPVIIYRSSTKFQYFDCRVGGGACSPVKVELPPVINTGPILTGDAIKAAQGR
jgi:hypothetical protein